MSSTQYRADMQDLHFVFFDQLAIHEQLAGFEAFAEFDRELYEATLDEARKLAEDVMSPINFTGDKVGVRLEDGQVITPEGFKEAWNLVAEGGWIGVSFSPELGGIGLPQIIGMAVNELFSASAMAFSIYIGLTGSAARVIAHNGSEELKEKYVERMIAGEWAGTMLLTEAGAGSAVGDNRTKAVPSDEDGVYLLEGEKIFISGGDQDLTENIIHLALARTPGAPAGTKGLSLFLVPNWLVNDDGELTERNDIRVVGIEHKLGINGSATCTLALGTNGPCKGWLIGNEFDGIKLMFQMMNEARIGVGVQGLAAAGSAYTYARHYALERVQGPDLNNLRDPGAKSVPIVRHPDVRRMLMNLKVHAETMRSLLYRMALKFDIAESTDDPKLKKQLEGRIDLLVPIIKAFFSDKGFEMATMALQVYAGYGYTQEYPVEQLLRDAKISSIYEGTNGIQAMDLLGRKMRIKNGVLFMSWLQDAQKLVAQAKKAGLEEANAVAKAVGHVGATAMFLGQLGLKGKLKGAMLQASPFLRMFGVVLLALEALDQAMTAKRLIEESGETPFLKGKLLNSRYYATQILPEAVALGKAIQAGDTTPLDEALWLED